MAFVLLQLGLCFVDNFYGICILRFLTGFMGAPCLATGGASLQDVSTLTSPFAARNQPTRRWIPMAKRDRSQAFPPSQLGVLLSMWALSAFVRNCNLRQQLFPLQARS